MPSHRIRRGALALLLCLLALAGGGWWALAAALPDTFYTTGSAQALRIASLPWVTVQETPAEVEQAGRTGGAGGLEEVAAVDHGSAHGVVLLVFGCCFVSISSRLR